MLSQADFLKAKQLCLQQLINYLEELLLHLTQQMKRCSLKYCPTFVTFLSDFHFLEINLVAIFELHVPLEVEVLVQRAFTDSQYLNVVLFSGRANSNLTPNASCLQRVKGFCSLMALSAVKYLYHIADFSNPPLKQPFSPK